LWRRQWIGVLVALSGLAVAFAVSMIAILYVMDGITSDSWLENSDRLYRIESQVLTNGKKGGFSRGPYGHYNHLDFIRQNFTEIEAVTRVKPVTLKQEQENRTSEHQAYFVDASMHEVLNLPVLAGNIGTALQSPNRLVISRSKAEALFGSSDASILGTGINFVQDSRTEDRRDIQLDRNYTIAAIIEDIPPNSLFDFELIALRPQNDRSTNGFPHVGIYMLLKEGAKYKQLKPEFEKRLSENTPPIGSYSFDMFIEPLAGAMLNSKAYTNGKRQNIDGRTLWTIGTIALVLLLTAGFNYINVFTAINSMRGREIAVRRIAGAGYSHIVLMCLLEGILLASFAYGIALLLADDFTLFFTNLTGSIVPILDTVRAIPLMIGLLIAVIIGIVGALYPAYIMRRARPETLLRGSQGTVAGGRGRMRQALVSVQSFAAVGVMIGSLQIAWQMDHILNLERGFETEGIFFLKGPKRDDTDPFKGAFLEETRKLTGILKSDVTSDTLFASSIRIGNYRNPTQSDDKQVVLKFPGPSFLPLLSEPPVAQLGIDAGKDQIVIPMSTMTKFGFDSADDAIGKVLIDSYQPRSEDDTYTPPEYTIVAVINDLKDGVRFGDESITVYHVSAEQIPTHIIGQTKGITPDELNAVLKPKWEEFFPGQPYEVEWLIDRLAARYKSTQDMGLILNFISAVTLILSIAGLYGMARHWLLTRRRELALRKVMGANHRELIILAVRKMLTPIVIGGMIAFIPIWFLMQEWLTRFADKGELPLWLYGFVLVVVVVISGLILFGHTIKALREHPATVLYHE
jgi:putative ABC transport system permease protein